MKSGMADRVRRDRVRREETGSSFSGWKWEFETTHSRQRNKTTSPI